jgi:hypothetical protein
MEPLVEELRVTQVHKVAVVGVREVVVLNPLVVLHQDVVEMEQLER